MTHLDPLDEIDELNAELKKWKTWARTWETRANEYQQAAAASKRRAHDLKDRAHTWRLLYQDLLEKVGRKLDLEGELPNGKEQR